MLSGYIFLSQDKQKTENWDGQRFDFGHELFDQKQDNLIRNNYINFKTVLSEIKPQIRNNYINFKTVLSEIKPQIIKCLAFFGGFNNYKDKIFNFSMRSKENWSVQNFYTDPPCTAASGGPKAVF